MPITKSQADESQNVSFEEDNDALVQTIAVKKSLQAREFYSKEITQSVNTEGKYYCFLTSIIDLYKLVDFRQSSPYEFSNILIILEIVDAKLQSSYNCKYIMKYFIDNAFQHEIKFNYIPQQWNYYRSRQLVYYKPAILDQDSNYVILVDVMTKAISKLECFDTLEGIIFQLLTCIDMHILMCFRSNYNEYIAAGSEKELIIVQLTQLTEQQQKGKYKVTDLIMKRISTKLKILKMYYDTIIFETMDNQLDVYELIVQGASSNEDFVVEFKQQSEVFPRQLQDNNNSEPDFIKKVVYVKSGTFSYSAALRQSGNIDLYWDNQLKYSSLDGGFEDIDLYYNAFYFKRGGTIDEAECYEIKITSQLRIISFDMAILLKPSEFQWENIKNMRFGPYIKVYDFFELISESEAYMIVKHFQYISVYHLSKKQWINLLWLPDEIIKHTHTGGRVLNIITEKSLFQIPFADLCKPSHEIQRINDEKYLRFEFTQLNWVKMNKSLIIINQTNTKQQQEFLIIIGKTVLKNKSLYDKNTVFYPLSVAIVNDNQISEYRILQIDQTPRLQNRIIEIYNMENGQDEKLVDINEPIKNKALRYSEFWGAYSIGQPWESKLSIEDKATIIQYMDINIKRLAGYDFDYLIVIQRDTQLYWFSKNKQISVNLGILSIQGQSLDNIYMMRYFDSKYQLCITNFKHIVEFLKAESGSYYCDVLEEFDTPYLQVVPMNFQLQRFAYFGKMNAITVAPFVHTNNISFLEAGDLKNYFAYQQFDTRLTAMTIEGQLQTWNIYNGQKARRAQNLKLDWINDFQLHHGDNDSGDTSQNLRKGRSLLRSKMPIPLEDEALYLSQFEQISSMEGSSSFKGQKLKRIMQWKVIEIVNEKEIKEHVNFKFHLYLTEADEVNKNYIASGMQMMYLSCDFNYLIERLKYSRAYIYRATKRPNNEIKWNLIRKLDHFDSQLESQKLFYLPFYTQDFTKYIEFNRAEEIFQIRKTEDPQYILQIPKDILHKDGKQSICHAINKVQWIDNNRLRIVDGNYVEKIVDLQNNFKEICYNWLPFFKEANTNLTKYPYYCELAAQYSLLENLKNKYMFIKSSQQMLQQNGLGHLNRDINTINLVKMTKSDLSFTIIHWMIIDQIYEGKVNILSLPTEKIQELVYCILPDGNTLLHKLCESQQQDDIVALFNIAQPNKYNVKEITIQIPFTLNNEGMSPLHISKANNDYESISIMLRYLIGYPVDTHSKLIQDLIPDFIKKDLSIMPSYLESRCQQTEQMKNMTKLRIKEDYLLLMECMSINESKFKKQVEDPNEMVKRVKIEVIDIPGSGHYDDPNFNALFDALAEVDNFAYFQTKTIQAIISFNYKLVKKYTILKLFVPFIIFHTLFVIYFNEFYQKFISLQNAEVDNEEKSEDYIKALRLHIVVSIFLFVFSGYFILTEVFQMITSGFNYFINFWNYPDLFAPTFVIVALAIGYPPNLYPTTERAFCSLATFFMWLKVFYFLRIFDSTGFLIRILLKVIYDMKVFMLVLLCGIVMFSDSMLKLSFANDEQSQYLTGFVQAMIQTYGIILGGFDIQAYDNVVLHAMAIIFFVLCMLLNMIILLNLLIAIISKTFEDVNQNAEFASYQEKAALISENNYLIPRSIKKSYADHNMHILVITNTENNALETSNDIDQKLDDLKGQFTGIFSKVTEGINNQEEQQKEMKNQLKEIKKEQKEIKNEQKQIGNKNESDFIEIKEVLKKMVVQEKKDDKLQEEILVVNIEIIKVNVDDQNIKNQNNKQEVLKVLEENKAMGEAEKQNQENFKTDLDKVEKLKLEQQKPTEAEKLNQLQDELLLLKKEQAQDEDGDLIVKQKTLGQEDTIEANIQPLLSSDQSKILYDGLDKEKENQNKYDQNVEVEQLENQKQNDTQHEGEAIMSVYE